jgi:hypothetical protein
MACWRSGLTEAKTNKQTNMTGSILDQQEPMLRGNAELQEAFD